MDIRWLALQLRALKDGGTNFTADELLDAMDRTRGRRQPYSENVTPPTPEDVIENLQIIVNRRARKAA